MSRVLLVLVMASGLGGCASIVNESTHPLRIDAVTVAGEAVQGAQCTVATGHGVMQTRAGEVLQVKRGSQDLDVTCKAAPHPDAHGRLVSRVNAGMAGNIIFGGIVGAVIDHSKGTAYTYPTWVQLIFGRSLVFDRGEEQAGVPVKGRHPSESPATAAKPPNRRATLEEQHRW